jgi:hypothetical protein
MIRFIGALGALLLSTGAVAQTFPSPTYNNATITGTLNGQPVGALSLSGDCTASGTFTAAVTCLSTNGTPFSAAATTAIGTSGATIPLLSTANAWSGSQTAPSFVTGNTTLSDGNITRSTGNTNITTPGNIAAHVGSGNNFIVNDSVHGNGLVIGGNTAAITGQLTITPGQASGAIALTTGGSSFAPTSIALQPGTQGSINVFAAGLSGTYTPESSTIPFNCSGVQGIVTVCNNSDSMAANGIGIPTGLNIQKQIGGSSGTTGGRYGLDVTLDLVPGFNTSDTGNVFYQAVNFAAVVNASMGGNSSNYIGSVFTGGSNAKALTGGLFINQVTDWEDDLSIQTGASAFGIGGHSAILLSDNQTLPASGEAWGFLVGAQTGAVNSWTAAYLVGGYNGPSQAGLASSAYIIGYHPNGFTGSGPSIQGFADASTYTFSGSAIKLPTGDLFGTGNVRAGHTLYQDGVIDPTGWVGTGASAVSAGGSGYTATNLGHASALNMADQFGGEWTATIAGGQVTAVSMIRAPWSNGGAPSTTGVLTSEGNQPGTGATITITWVRGATITMNGVDILGGAGTTVSALPTCNTALKGGRTFVTDATSPTFLGTLTGSGAVVAPVFCNGTAWVAG